MKEVAAELEDLPGMRSILTQPIEMRMNEMVAGIRSDLGIRLFGDDFDQLRDLASKIRRVVEVVPGAADVAVEQITGQPVLRIEVDRDAAARYGVPVREILEVVESLGIWRVGEVIEGQRRFDLAVRLDERYRDDPRLLGRLPIIAPGGERLRLSEVADIGVVEGPSTIQREWGRRRVTIQTNVRDRDLGSFVAEVRERVDALDLPDGYYVRYGGQFEHLERARDRLLIVVPVALALILSLLYLTFGRVRDALIVFSGVPFAAVGGVVALWIRGMPLSISAAIGFVAVSGVAVLGQLVLVSRARQLLRAGRSLPDATREAAETRLRAVLMTGLTDIIGFVPMALSLGVGAEVQRPLATVVIGGVATSMLATLVVLPVLYQAFGRELPEEERDALEMHPP